MFSLFVMPEKWIFGHFLASSESKLFFVKKEDMSSKRRTCGKPNQNHYFSNTSEIAMLSLQTEELYITFGLISEAHKKLDSSLDDLNQYGRRNCLVLHGLSANTDLPNSQSNYKEFLDKIIKKINDNLSLNLSSNNIDIAHPLPVTKNGKTPVIIKFLRRSDRNLVYQNKRHFSKSGLAITESLTKKRLQLLKEAGSLLGQENVWTSNGTIFCNINAKREVIKTQDDLYSLVKNTYSNSAPSIELNNSNK